MSLSELFWVELWVNILTRVKSFPLKDSQRLRFVQLICLAEECSPKRALFNGQIRQSTAKIARNLQITKSTLTADLKALQSVGLINIEQDGTIILPGFVAQQEKPGDQGVYAADKHAAWREQIHQQRNKPGWDFFPGAGNVFNDK